MLRALGGNSAGFRSRVFRWCAFCARGHLTIALLLALVCSYAASGQNYRIETLAGGALPADGALAVAAGLSIPQNVAVDAAGNLFVALPYQGIVSRIDATTGQLTRVAGNGTPGYNGDNIAAVSAQLFYPSGLAVDSAGNLYIADQFNYRVRKVSASTGMITTVAGTGTMGYNGDNIPAATAELSSPSGVAVDSAGNLYIADQDNARVRQVSAATGTITTVAGNGITGYNGDNVPATTAELLAPIGLAVDSAGNLYIADRENFRIRKVSAATGTITTVAGNGTNGFNGDNIAATSAELTNLSGVAVDAAGNLYIADQFNDRIRKVSPATGIITTVAGNGMSGYNGDNIPAIDAELSLIPGIIDLGLRPGIAVDWQPLHCRC